MKASHILLCLLVCMQTVHAQGPSALYTAASRAALRAVQITSPAPEAAALGKYVNMPTGLYSGTPDIKIPLYELKGNSLTLPVSLRFHAGGFRPQEAPAWTGQHWSLHAGGVITRYVRGKPDDEHYRTSVLPSGDNFFALQDTLRQLRNGEQEMEPDLYCYNFGPYSGKFIITPAGEIITKEKNMLRISRSGAEMSVTDDKGNIYRFADVDSTLMEIPADTLPDAATVLSYNYISSWYLTSITSANGHEKILFSYQLAAAHPLDARHINNRSVSWIFNTILRYDSTGSSSVVNTIDTAIYAPAGPFTYSTRNFPQQISLVRDDSLIAYITLHASGNREDTEFSDIPKLDSLSVYNAIGGNHRLAKRFRAAYSYFTNAANTFMPKRLRLDSLQEVSLTTTTPDPPPYRFYYYTDADMPELFTTGIDHWGFYNKATNSTLLPAVSIAPPVLVEDTLIGGYANREPDLNGSAYALLRKIVYPTNGFTTYDYALHTALDEYDDSTHILGGVRVTAITDYALGNKPARTRLYNYNQDNGKTSGRTDALFPGYLYISSYCNRDTDTHTGDYLQEAACFTVSAGENFPAAVFQGGHIGYRQVTETVTDSSRLHTLGKTVYTYRTDTLDSKDENIANGTLSAVKIYNRQGKLLNEQQYYYAVLKDTAVPAVQVWPEMSQTNEILWCLTTGTSGDTIYNAYTPEQGLPAGCAETRTYPVIWIPGGYSFLSQRKYLTTKTEKIYDQQTTDFLLNGTLYSYENPLHIYPSVITTFTNNSEQLVTRKKYIADYAASAAGPDDAGIPLMLFKYIPGAEVESYQYRQTVTGTDKRIISGVITRYGADLLPVQVSRIETKTPLISYQESALTAGVFTTDASYKPWWWFTYKNGVLASRRKEKGILSTWLWGYNNSYPVAEITNGNNLPAGYAGFEDAGLSWSGAQLIGYTINDTIAYTGSHSGNLFFNSVILLPATTLNASLTLSFWLRTGTVVVKQGTTVHSPAVTGPVRNGWTYYQYNLIGAAAGHIILAGSNAIADELRLVSAYADITTYTYQPLVGATSSNPPDNRTQISEYDGLNRLLNIRDGGNNIRRNFLYNYGPGMPVDEPVQAGILSY
ncbi:hypothetical protein [Chitinophaga solisilvae]|uniref:hypothetical protein n=1 Tax=Chitinophaga solisilvae TaxID=1233460 RepID=UPI00136A02FD|nr:hypothetical protein [Chitinophaga solisilvae]